MKYIMIAIPGAADYPAEELGGKTPLEVGKVPNLNYFSKIGRSGQVNLLPERLEPSSDVSFLEFLGYEAEKVYPGRGPLEAANLELKLEANEIAFRMNFITESDGILADPTGGRITTKEAKALVSFLNKKVASDFVRFFPGAEYRHVAVIKDSHGFAALSAKTKSPDTIIGEKISENFPIGPGEELLRKLMFDAKLLLQDHEINQVRVDLQENPANMIWLWGQGQKPELESFQKRYGISGALVAGTEYAKGIARLAKLTVVDVQGSTGNLETDYEKKGEALMEVLEEKDFTCVHLGACDEASRLGDLKGKISALEAMDFFIFSKVKKFLEDKKNVRIVISPCHYALWKTKTHTRGSVPFVLAGKNVTPDDIEKYSEVAAKTSDLKISKGSEWMKLFLKK
ncbi:MAG: 2,3-bisphosphoglycerate-independent phosphoglycerate mutase [Candidatus Omnitrophica bacterium]|nr:2,3-bisphosphoglycerate-independent phosphoglycerate mutase [Candidatus Omnitrophota bacterium]